MSSDRPDKKACASAPADNQLCYIVHRVQNTLNLILQTGAGTASNIESEQVLNKNARDSADMVRFTAPAEANGPK